MVKVCDNCGREFRCNYTLTRHLNRKISCKSASIVHPNVHSTQENVHPNVHSMRKIVHDVHPNVHSTQDDVHSNVHPVQHQCKTCKKIFSSRQSLYNHKKRGKCAYTETNAEEIERLRKENEELRKEVKVQNINTNCHNTNIVNINYDPSSGLLSVEDDPSQKLLCINKLQYILNSAFQQQHALDFNNNNDELKSIIRGIDKYEDFDPLYRYLFRNEKYEMIQSMKMNKDLKETHAKVFQDGKLVNMGKDVLFRKVMVYVVNLMGKTCIDFIEQCDTNIYEALSSNKSKQSFAKIITEDSEIFQFFKDNL